MEPKRHTPLLDLDATSGPRGSISTLSKAARLRISPEVRASLRLPSSRLPDRRAATPRTCSGRRHRPAGRRVARRRASRGNDQAQEPRDDCFAGRRRSLASPGRGAPRSSPAQAERGGAETRASLGGQARCARAHRRADSITGLTTTKKQSAPLSLLRRGSCQVSRGERSPSRASGDHGRPVAGGLAD